MKITGENTIAAPQQDVWLALNDPEILRQSIPGCDSLEVVGENQFKATVTTRIGPITAKFSGTVELADIDAPNGYTLSGSGTAGAMGGAKGKAYVSLTTIPEGTHLKYDVDAEMSGKIAQLGGRLIQSTAGVLAGQFFKRFAELVGGPTKTDATTTAPAANGGLPKWIYIAGGLIIVALAAFWLMK